MSVTAPHVVVSLSGGKDSTAAALYLRRLGVPFSWVFADTGWEHEETYRYVHDVLPALFGPGTIVRREAGPLPPIVDDEGRVLLDVEPLALLVEELLPPEARPSPMVRSILRDAMFPSQVVRWCTENLKWHPIMAHLRSLGGPVVNVIGVRRDESAKRASTPEWSPHPVDPTWATWAPLCEWSEADVIAEHGRAGIAPNPLYLGRPAHRRVGCWPCVFANNKHDLRVLARDETRIEAMRRMERIMHLLYAVTTRKRTTVPTFFPHPNRKTTRMFRCESKQCGVGRLRKEPGPCPRCGVPLSEHVTKPWRPGPVDDVIAWGLSDRGGQGFLFGADAEAGCGRWGLCEAVPAAAQGHAP